MGVKIMPGAKALETDNFYFEFDNAVKPHLIKGNVHYHNSYEIYYLTEGNCKYFIDKKTYNISAGDIVLIPKGVIHKTHYETPNHRRILINCSGSYIPFSVKTKMRDITCFSGSPSTKKKIEENLMMIEKEYYAPDEFSDDIIRNRLGEILLLIARSAAVSRDSDEIPVVDRALEYIHSHYMTNMTLSETAAYCYISKEHLSRIFKKETGFGFNEYLTIYRLKKAECLLRDHPKGKISEIAYLCGFNDSNYFSKVYKKMYNVSPTQTKNSGESD